MRTISILLGIFFISSFLVITIYPENVYGQYFECNPPQEIHKSYQEKQYVLKFVGTECDNYEMILTIQNGDDLKEINLNEHATGSIFLKMDVFQNHLYLVWNDVEIKNYHPKDPSKPSFYSVLKPISVKQISLDGNNISKTVPIEYEGYTGRQIIDLLEIQDEILLFWLAVPSDSEPRAHHIIKSEIKNQSFDNHETVVKGNDIAIKKSLFLQEHEMHLVFFRMINGCKEESRQGQCWVNYEWVLLATSPKLEQGSEYGIVPTPRQQMKMGLTPEEIVCKVDLDLFIKNGKTPLCLKPFSDLHLSSRGWELLRIQEYAFVPSYMIHSKTIFPTIEEQKNEN